MSPACRAARSHQLASLPAAAILRALHDVDYEKCQQHSLVHIGWAALLLILLPAFLATISTSYCINLMDMFIYTFLNMVLLVTYVIFLISVPVITICCAVIGGYILYYYGVFAGAVRNAPRLGIIPRCTPRDIPAHLVSICPNLTHSNMSHPNSPLYVPPQLTAIHPMKLIVIYPMHNCR